MVVFLLVVLSCAFPLSAQKVKIPKDPVQVIDSSTEKPIAEVLVIPIYAYAVGAAFPPEGPGKAFSDIHYYVDNPFIYRTGEAFNVKRPAPFTGVPLLFLFAGKFRETEGVLVLAPGFRPFFMTERLWAPLSQPKYVRKFDLSPVAKDNWQALLANELRPFVDGLSHVRQHCYLFGLFVLDEKCKVEIEFDTKQRRLVRSFLETPLSKSN